MHENSQNLLSFSIMHFTKTGCATGQVRLQGGANSSEGRVEICLNNEWGTVCDEMWDAIDAIVVCRQLRSPFIGIHNNITDSMYMYCTVQFTGAEALTGASFGEGTGMIWLTSVECTGNESMLMNCTSRSSSVNTCSHAQDAGVRCPPGYCYS